MTFNAPIYADYQATTPVDPRVLNQMLPFWGGSFGNPHSNDHVVGWRAAEAVRESQISVSRLIGADTDEIVFTSGATEANNLALFGLARGASPSRRRILVSAIEHKCVLAAVGALEEREGFNVEVVPVDSEGFIDLSALEDKLDDSVLLASIMAVNNEVGTIQDLPEIAGLLARHGVVFHCDAAQAPCAMDTAHLAECADLISLSGHKIYGPQGIGALYIRRELHSSIEPMIYGGGQQNGLRSGTVPVPLCVGMAAAAEIIRVEGADERLQIACQRDLFMGLLLDSGFQVAVNGPTGGRRHPGNANLRFGGFAAQEILGSVQPRLAASSGAACASGIPEPSHVLRALGLGEREADSSVRFSFGRFSTNRDVREAATLVVNALESLVQGGVAPVPAVEG
ncbi:MAG: cysteine desulfurase [Chloroflexi bacterium]|nr:cysteine desulfurase [Chloroflexota bacterium]